jgi:hypothetical protein
MRDASIILSRVAGTRTNVTKKVEVVLGTWCRSPAVLLDVRPAVV